MQLPGIDMGNTQSSVTDLVEQLSAQFVEPARYGRTLFVLGLAVCLGAALAYHPSARRKVTSRETLEQPKTFVMYALVGALAGHIVSLNPAMALVVFGIGGLMRFRTDVGEAKDTGRVILAAIVGICCGVESFLVAVLATAAGWVLIWYLERQVIGSVTVHGVGTDGLTQVSAGYRRVLEALGCRVVGERLNAKKEQIEIVFTAPDSFDVKEASALVQGLPDAPRGVPTWEIS